MQGKPLAEQEIGNQLLIETQAYAESSICRRKLLLHYFGEEYKEDNCGNCDNCMKPQKFMEAQELLTLILETISILKEKFKAEHIVDILKGNETSDVVSYQHNELENFGAATDEDEKLLQAVIRQALISGYITKDVETYGVLKLTPKGRDFLKNPTSFPIVKDTDFEEDEEVNLKNIASTSAADEVLFSILKDLRKKLSKKLDVPPFVIFQDPSLEAMATTYPITMDELQNISGSWCGESQTLW
jgi:ATP-dependent DNA helicase RecQ